MNRIKILTLCLITSLGFAQQSLNKTSQSIKTNKDVVVDLNTNYVEIEVDTWNKDVVEVEAYIESAKLSKEELQKALKAWNLKVDASTDKVSISSEGGRSLGLFSDASSYDDILKDLEFNLADLPEVPEVIVIPEMPNMANIPQMPELPAMPEFPELPELPEGIKTIKFDYDRYQEEGEKYLEEWSKRYEKEGGKELQERMTEWARKFGESDYQKKMEAWGEEYGKRFEGQWAKEMEKWGEEFGEKFGKDMEKWGEEFGEKFGKEWEEKMEAWGERFERKMEKEAKLLEREAERASRRAEQNARVEARMAEMEARREQQRNVRESMIVKRLESRGSDSKVKKVIKLKIPKKAKLKLNVRHGELKLSSVLHNTKGDISHTFFVAEHIDGSDTSINVSYSPMVVNTWNAGILNLNFVDKAQIKNASYLMLNSKSSNIAIDNLTNTGIINGSFGDLTISNLADTFSNLNLVLENSDALINLPSNADYNLYFKGDRSKYNNKPTNQKTIRKDDSGQSNQKSVVVNAKYSNVIVN